MSAETNTGNPALSPAISGQIADIVRQTPNFHLTDFRILGETNDDVIAPDFATLLDDPEATVVYGLDGEDVTGFSLAIPIGRMDKTRQDESAETAYIYYTAIRPSLRGRGLVGPLMEKMYARLREQGYRYVERDAVLTDDWADKVERNHQGAILKSYEHDKWGMGKERFFRIDLEKLGVEKPDL